MKADIDIIAENTVRLGVVVLASSLLGFVLEVSLAWRYGSSEIVDAFRVASTVLTIGTNLFFIQLIPHVVLPLFNNWRYQQGETRAWKGALSLNVLVGVACVVFVVLIFLWPDAAVRFLAPGFTGATKSAAAILVRAFGLAFLLVVWSGTLSAVLFSYGVVWTTAAGALFINAAVILFVLSGVGRSPALSLSFGIVTGAVVLALVHVLLARKHSARAGTSLRDWFRPGISSELGSVGRQFITFAGVAVFMQASGILIYRALSHMPVGTPAIYGYSLKLTILVHATAAAFTTAAFPEVSRLSANADRGLLCPLAERSIRITLFLAVPATAILMSIRAPLVRVVFGATALSAEDLITIATVLGILLIGAPTGAICSMLMKLFASIQDNRGSLLASVAAVLVLAFSLPFCVASQSLVGVAAAWSLSAVVQLAILFGYLFFRHRLVAIGRLSSYAGRLTVVSALSGCAGLLVIRIAEFFDSAGATTDIVQLCAGASLALTVLYGSSRMLGIPEAADIGLAVMHGLRRARIAIPTPS